jgi:hypothetical protein
VNARSGPASSPYYKDIISDGTRYYVLNERGAKYVLHPLNAGGITKESQGAGCFQDGTLGDMLLNHQKSYLSDTAKFGKVLGQETVDSVDCTKIEASLPAEASFSPERRTFWIGISDHMLRKVEDRSDSLVMTERYLAMRINQRIAPKKFKITASKTAQRVEKL